MMELLKLANEEIAVLKADLEAARKELETTKAEYKGFMSHVLMMRETTTLYLKSIGNTLILQRLQRQQSKVDALIRAYGDREVKNREEKKTLFE